MHRSLVQLPAVVLLTLLPQAVAAQSAEDEIRQTLVEMWDAIEHGDVQRYATFIHDDFTSFGETDTYLNEGKQKELQGVASWTARSADIRTNMHQPHVTIRGETAWITYYWTDEAESRLTGERETSRGKSTRVFVREGWRWLCIHGHYTLVQ